MLNEEIVRIFSNIADILEIRGDNRFRIRAYRRAAQNVESLAVDVAGMSEEQLRAIPGIGADLAEKIGEYAHSGTVKLYDELKREVPEGLLRLLSVPGLGPKTAKLLFEKMRISTVNDLEREARAGRLRELPGIKAKTEENIIKGIEMIRRHTGRYPIGRVLPLAEEILRKLKKDSPAEKLVIAGSLRRWKDTIKDIDILCTAKKAQKVMDVFVHLPEARQVLMKGPTKSSVVTSEGIQVDLRVVPDNSYGAALAYFTGSREHNIRLREMAVKKKLKINEYGIFDTRTDRKKGGRSEQDVYSSLGLPFIPPELREDGGEIEAAQGGTLPDLVTIKDIRGDLHVHSRDSDGSHDMGELVQYARSKGYQYMAITDHSQGLGIAGGMKKDQILKQIERVRALRKKTKGFTLLAGAEIDIRSDGSLDYPDEILKKLDIVIASIHSGFRQSREKITMRLVAAARNPYVTIIAHPTGRILGERDAYAVDMEQLFGAARETSTVLEINAYPFRLDLSDQFIRRAQQLGILLAINTDAHVSSHFDFMRYGVGVARRGWLEKKDVLNCLSPNQLIKKLGKKHAM